ncbi:putative RdRP [Myrmica rubra virus 6]|nr:putative RdRP [Myrmica rubra virus 6]UXD80026.1 putative RdRP [Myrmica rubra virus 6]
MIDRIIFGPLARAVVETAGKTPLMVGDSLFAGSWRRLRAAFGSRNLAIDKSGWDWSMQAWLIEFFRVLLKHLNPGATAEWWTVVNARLDLLFKDAVFGFRDGTYIAQLLPGIMKSGCYITIILNSLCQLALHYGALLDLGLNPRLYKAPKCLGDDTTQAAQDLIERGYVAALENLGCVVKEAEVHKDMEFAGFKITHEYIRPMYLAKHLFKLMYNSNLPEWLEQMQGLYAYRDDMLVLLRKVCLATRNADRIRSKRFGLDILG